MTSDNFLNALLTLPNSTNPNNDLTNPFALNPLTSKQYQNYETAMDFMNNPDKFIQANQTPSNPKLDFYKNDTIYQTPKTAPIVHISDVPDQPVNKILSKYNINPDAFTPQGSTEIRLVPIQDSITQKIIKNVLNDESNPNPIIHSNEWTTTTPKQTNSFSQNIQKTITSQIPKTTRPTPQTTTTQSNNYLIFIGIIILIIILFMVK